MNHCFHVKTINVTQKQSDFLCWYYLFHLQLLFVDKIIAIDYSFILKAFSGMRPRLFICQCCARILWERRETVIHCWRDLTRWLLWHCVCCQLPMFCHCQSSISFRHLSSSENTVLWLVNMLMWDVMLCSDWSISFRHLSNQTPLDTINQSSLRYNLSSEIQSQTNIHSSVQIQTSHNSEGQTCQDVDTVAIKGEEEKKEEEV